MKFSVLGIALLTGGFALAQPPAAPSSNDAPDIGQPLFRATTQQLIAPVLVTDKGGNIIDGLQPYQFRLFDRGKEQNIQVDVTSEPISLVVAIEKSARVEGILPQIRKLGILLTQITGRSGEAAVEVFDSHLQTVQDFTTDNDKIKVAIDRINAGNTGTRIIDAVESGIHMLAKRPKSNRKIILLVSESRDEGSEARLKETLLDAQFANVQVYHVDITQVAVRLNEKQDQPYPTAYTPTGMPMPMGIAATPTTMEQQFGLGNRVQFIPVLKEIFTDVKGIFVRDSPTQFVRSTGGAEFMFLRQKGLEEAIMKISQQVHSQYMVSYTPSNVGEGGYHEIEVVIDRMPEYTARTRPGYWVGGGAQ